MSSHGQHAFIAPGQGDVRSPCPALNTLANHGYINRSGKGISASSLIASLTSIYHLSLPLATTLVAGGFLSCCSGDIGEGISLHALAAHNKIEHDASLVHDDALPGAKFAPTQVNQTLVNDLLHTYPGGLGIYDFAEARWIREMMLSQEKKPKLNMFHEEIGHGEAALTWLLMKDNTDVVNAKTLRQWYGVETFPETYVIPTEEISLEMARTVSAEIGRIMKRHS
ncbi:Chloroperoxidase [Lentinula aff. lateritia]|uniref:Chloroperoxidase n=1 Tax=Lentinula aff. lateritia TaxID=2804960 RepID=A0ACC1TUV2_9AGAR|nr:Chloroperoxidase [Lentinula aff. lateritia]